MTNTRRLYEKRAEIWTKKLLSRLYSMEARAMETQLNVQKGLDKVNDKIDWDSRIKKLAEERENVYNRFQEMINSSNEKWKQVSGAFENYYIQINESRRDVADRANDWVEEANTWVNDMEERAMNYGKDFYTRFGEQRENLKKHRDRLNEKLNQLRKAGNDRVDNIRSGLESDINNLRTTLTNLIQHYRKEDKDTSQEEAV